MLFTEDTKVWCSNLGKKNILCLWRCFSGIDFEDMIAGLTWPCTLPPGWSVEWDGPSARADTPPAE